MRLDVAEIPSQEIRHGVNSASCEMNRVLGRLGGYGAWADQAHRKRIHPVINGQIWQSADDRKAGLRSLMIAPTRLHLGQTGGNELEVR